MLQSLNWPLFQQRGVKIFVWREDQNHAQLSGNKLHKLQSFIEHARVNRVPTLISFGGPWSNHLYALAWAGQHYGLKTIGLVRGHPDMEITPTLQDAQHWGMELHWLDRLTYRSKNNADYLARLHDQFGPALVIPEGGSDSQVVQSFKSLNRAIRETIQPDWLFCATGTGGTLAGLVSGGWQNTRVVGIQCVAEGSATQKRIADLLTDNLQTPNWDVWVDGHLGGFAKTNQNLLHFIRWCDETLDLPLDQVYNAKVLLRVAQAAEQGCFSAGQRLLVLHTGGLQGRRGISNQLNALPARHDFSHSVQRFQ